MGIVGDFINNIKSREGLKFDGQVADLLGIDRRILANWKSRDSLPTSYQKWYCDRYKVEIKDFQKEIKLTNTDIQLKGENSMEIQADYVIELQKDKIKQQAQEIEILQSYLNNHPIEKIQWNDINPHMESIVLVRNVLSFKKMERKMTIDKSGVKLEKLLGLPKGHNYFDDSKWYPMDEHPIDEIIDNKSLEELKKISNTLPSLFESFKFIVGDHYMSFPVIYSYKDKRVITQCSIMLEWRSSPKKILTKTVFINPEVN